LRIAAILIAVIALLSTTPVHAATTSRLTGEVVDIDFIARYKDMSAV
jgi:hypothetical protein